MKSAKTMFLGFLVILTGIAWLIALVTAIPAGTTTPLNPFVAMFAPYPYSGPTDVYLSYFARAIQGGEWLAFVIILGGLLIGIVGYFRE